MNDYLKINGLIPHHPPMLAVGSLISLKPDEAVSSTEFTEDSIFLNDQGQFEEAALFEMMAQTFAAMAAAGSMKGKPADRGFLVGLKKIRFSDLAVSLEKPIEIKVKLISQVEDFYVVEGEARQNACILASGQLTIMIPPPDAA